jgi:hypothetical protein
MTQAVAADYADAMLVARRAKNTLFLLLALILLIQMGVFFVVRYVPNVKIHAEVTTTSDVNTSSATLLERNAGGVWSPLLEQVIAGTDFLGVLFSMVLPVILLLVITIMLVGRLVGVSHVTSAFCWSIVFLVLLFPWQSLLNSHVHAMAAPMSDSLATTRPSEQALVVEEAPDVRIPGVLYTFPELRRNYSFASSPLKPAAILGWGRFVGVPIIELILLLIVQGRSSRGLRFALGEAELPMEMTPTGA